ncbi:MAG TPA: CPBP family intramembrane glutamic endopeptidase [Candidatus Dormibacteraeota bacterium]
MDSAGRAVSGRRVLAVIILWPLAAGLVVVATLLLLRVTGRMWARAHAADIGAIALLEAYLVLLAVLGVVFGGLNGIRDRLGFHFTSYHDLLLALLAWLAALTVGGIITALLTPLLGVPKSNASAVLGIGHDPLFVGLVVPTVALIAPAAEELLFRGAIFGWLRTRLPLVLAVLISAAVFAGAHLIPPLFPVFFVFGCAAALVYRFTGSTLNSFAMHATQNSLAVLVTYIAMARGSLL